MPEMNKATLKSQLTAEVMGALIQRPDLRVVKVADGAPDNWSYLGETLPFGVEVLDFYHATEHLGAALGAAYGAALSTCPHTELNCHLVWGSYNVAATRGHMRLKIPNYQ